MKSEIDEGSYYRRWVCDTSGRYYETRITRELWGNWYVLRIWGRIGSALGAQRSDLATNLEEALQIVERTAQRRIQRGYRPS